MSVMAADQDLIQELSRYDFISRDGSMEIVGKYLGSEPTTSANPPVLIKGTHSEATNSTFFTIFSPFFLFPVNGNHIVFIIH